MRATLIAVIVGAGLLVLPGAAPAGSPTGPAPAVAGASGPDAAPSARRQVKRCRRGQVRVAPRGRAARCVSTRALTRGLPRTSAGLLGSLVSQARPGPAARGSIAAALGGRANDVFAWEDRLVAAGQRAIAARKQALGLAGARAAQTGGDNDLGLQIVGPLGWGMEAAALLERLKSGSSGTDIGRTREQTKGTLISLEGESYSFALQGTDGVQVKCPKAGGIVEATGTFTATRTYTVPGQGPVTENLTGTFTITGRVNRQAQLTSYDVKVSVSDAGSATPTSGQATGIKPRATAKESAIITSKEVKITGGRAGRERLVAAAIGYAQREGLAFVQDAENVFNREASCLKAEPTPKTVKSGQTAQVTIKVISRITGKTVESDLTLQPSGGATVTPQKTSTTPANPAKVKVKMPAKGKGSRARAAATASVAITGLSELGRARGRVGSDEIPEAYDVRIQIQGQGRFATHDASGTLDVTVLAPRQGEEARWTGTAQAAWTDVGAASKTDCSYGSPVSGGPIEVTVTLAGDDAVSVTWGPQGDGNGLLATLTATCPADPRPAVIAGQAAVGLVGISEGPFRLPLGGGSQALSGGVTTGSDGFFNTGTLTLTPRETR
jgi:hypothetical protein